MSRSMTFTIPQGIVNVLDVQAWKGSQSLNFTGVYDLAGHRLQVSIKRDSYNAQSYAKVERWDGTEWKLVRSVPFNADTLCCFQNSYAQQGNFPYTAFETDAQYLLKLAAQVVL